MTATAFSHDPLLDPEIAFPETELALVTPDPLATVHELPVHPASANIERYRRRRFFAALALTAIVLLGAQVLGISLLSVNPLSAADTITAVDDTPLVHVVRPGDSYGAVAASLGAESPLSAAQALRRSNGGAELVVGQRLVIDRSILD